MKAENTTSLFESAPVADVNFEVLAKTAVKQRSWRETLTDSNVVHLHTHREVDEETLSALQADQIGSSEEALPQYTPADALIRAKILSEAQVASLQEAGKRRDGFDLIQAVVEKHITSEEVVAQALVREFGYQRAYLRREEDLQTSAWQDHDLQFLQQNRIIPFKSQSEQLHVAVCDERGIIALREFRSIGYSTIIPHIITLSQFSTTLSEIEEKVALLMKGETASSFSGDVIGFVELLLHASVSDGVSDIHIEPYAKDAVIRRRIDGVMQEWPVSDFLFENYGAVVARIKILSALNISERRLPQDGAITIEHDGSDVDIRVSVLPALFGERVVMRILNKGSIDMNIDTLGFGSQELMALKRALDAPQGMVLVTGPTGSGKSTTLYSGLNRINRPELNILTAEDPVEYQMRGIGQVQVKDEIGLDFATVLRSFLRQDPDVVLVGEIRDKETVDIAIKAALTGHLVLSTLHTNDAVSTIFRLINIGVPGYLIASSLKLIVAQRLARKICTQCSKVDETVSPIDLIKIGFSKEQAFNMKTYRGQGCNHCHGTGYKGRQGIYEVLTINDRIREVIETGKSADEIQQIATEDGFNTMQQIARGLIENGTLSMVEYSRVMLID